MLLEVGDKVRLVEIIRSTMRCNDWKTGIYEVEKILPSVGQYHNTKNPRMAYYFRKCKPGGGYTRFMNGYSTDEFDQMIQDGKAVKLSAIQGD